MPVADGVLRGADEKPLSRGEMVDGEIESGIHVTGEIVTILKGDIVVVWNTNETPPRKRSGKHYKFSHQG